MQAVLQREYGSADVLRLEDHPRPEAGKGVLVRMHAAAVCVGDWHLMTGLPYLIRLMGFGLRRPKHAVPGQYVAGVVEEDASGTFEPGDEVFGWCQGSYAQYVAVPAGQLVRKPAAWSFEQAAALPHGGFTAWQALRGVEPGQRVLVHGASGAVGSLAVEIAKAGGAHVTASCRANKAEFVRSLGADEVTEKPFGETYDRILDNIHNRPDATYRRALRPGGRSILVSTGTGRWTGGVQHIIYASFGSVFTSRKLVPFLATPDHGDLEELAKLADTVTPRIDRAFPLYEIADAFTYLRSGAVRGHVVVTSQS
ncbi:MAG: NAD(P)-dependent alcohol dehydrogenase [Planctomycetota bacterium]